MKRDRMRRLGAVYLSFPALVAATAVAVAFGYSRGQPGGAAAVVYWALTWATCAAFAVTGQLLLDGHPRAVPFAIACAGWALLAFPVGTVPGLWALRELTADADAAVASPA